MSNEEPMADEEPMTNEEFLKKEAERLLREGGDAWIGNRKLNLEAMLDGEIEFEDENEDEGLPSDASLISLGLTRERWLEMFPETTLEDDEDSEEWDPEEQ